MTNFLSFSEHLDINEMLKVSFTEEEINDIDKLTEEIILSENYEEAYALYEGEKFQKLKDAFKRNPDEGAFTRILKYLITGWTGAAVGELAGPSGAVVGTLFSYLVLAVYRRNTDICESKKNSPINWWRCQKDGAEKAKAILKGKEAETLSALNKKENSKKEIEKFKKVAASKMEYLDKKIEKCDAKIKYLS
jgi:hypothetical protein